MTKAITARTTAISARRRARKRIMSSRRVPMNSPARQESDRRRGASLLGAPLLDPERRRDGVAGRAHALQPFRQDVAVGAEEERQRGQLVGVDRLDALPQRAALAAVELLLELVDEPVDLRVLE